MEYGVLKNKEVLKVGGVNNYLTYVKDNGEQDPAERKVGHTNLNRRKHIFVSTVFLPFNHSWSPESTPQWFETMIFGTSMDGWQRRYETHEQAERGHREAVGLARRARQIRGRSRRDFNKSMRDMRRFAKTIRARR